jgi:2-polyprenyl-3-methyl-5-hydroxy-6-metoxy-1,4-benzoquinol methylase
MDLEAHRYIRHDVPKFEKILDFMPQGKLRVLDYACNVGTWCRWLKDKRPNYEICGTDLEPVYIDTAQKLGDEAEYHKLDEPFEGQFDIMTIMEVVEHVPNTEQYFKELIVKYLKSGGTLIITTPREIFPQGAHIQIWDYNRLFNFCWFYLGTDKVSFKYTDTDNTMICMTKPTFQGGTAS